MKIFYFIFSHGSDRGGHYQSLLHLTNEIGKTNEIKIFTIGNVESEIIKNSTYYEKNLYINPQSIYNSVKYIKQEYKHFNPDVLHCFDWKSFVIIKFFFQGYKTNLILNLCGGPNPRLFPKFKNLIVFSEENYNWFKQNKLNQECIIELIPNRVHPIETNKGFESYFYDENYFTFMRIARIGVAYKNGILKSINLIKKLQESGVRNVRLILVGYVEDLAVFNSIMESVDNINVSFITEPCYTKNASKMLYLADAIIGTGRGLMEATSLSKPVLTFDKNAQIPILVDNNNYRRYLSTNFSERNQNGNLIEQASFDEIKDLINDCNTYKFYSTLSHNLFESYFDVKKGADKYVNFYRLVKKEKIKIVLKDFIWLIRILKFYIGNRLR